MSLNTFSCHISNGGSWVDLNDGVTYKVTGGTKESTEVRWRRIVATSPVMEGSYQVHAVKDEVEESLGVYVHGATQAAVSANLRQLEDLFSQFSYQVRFVYENSTETWNCQSADYRIERGQVYLHAAMAVFTATVPHDPSPTYS